MIDRLPAFSASRDPSARSAPKAAEANVPAFLAWALPGSPASPPPSPSPGDVSSARETTIDASALTPVSVVPSPSVPGAAPVPGPSSAMGEGRRPDTFAEAGAGAMRAPMEEAMRDAAIRWKVPPAAARPGVSAAGVGSLPAPSVADALQGVSGLPPIAEPIGASHAGHGATDDGATLHFAMHVALRDGSAREVVVVPMRLRALGALAQSPGDAIAFVPPPVIGATALPAVDAGIAPGVRSRPAARAINGVAMEAADAAPDPNAGGPAVLRPDDADLAEDVAARAGTPTEAAVWLARRVGWIQRAGHAPALWWRDYRLAPDEARRLAETLHRSATAEGVVLDRIVVNGRELWCGPQARPFHSPREPRE